VTIAPIGRFFRSLNCEIDFFDRVIDAFCPVILASSSAPVSTIFAFCVPSPRPMLTTTFMILGTAMTFAYPNSLRSAGTTSLL
jgi:hypothetical protein